MHLFSSKCPPSALQRPGVSATGRCDAFFSLEYQLPFCAAAAASDSFARRDRMLLHLRLGQATDLFPIIRSKETASNGVSLPTIPTCLGKLLLLPSACRSRLTAPCAVPRRSLPAQHPAASAAVLGEGSFLQPFRLRRRVSRGIPAPGGAGTPLGRPLPAASCRPPPHVTPPAPKMAAGRPARSRRGRRARLQDGGQWRPPETA